MRQSEVRAPPDAPPKANHGVAASQDWVSVFHAYEYGNAPAGRWGLLGPGTFTSSSPRTKEDSPDTRTSGLFVVIRGIRVIRGWPLRGLNSSYTVFTIHAGSSIVCGTFERYGSQPLATTRSNKLNEAADWLSIAEIAGFPFETFGEMRAAVSERRFKVGVDPLAAAEWSAAFNTRPKRVVVTALSLLLIAAAVASVVVALAIEDYWLLVALPIQGLAFYVSHPASPIRKWVTFGGVASVIVFVNLLLNHLTTAAALTAYAGLTFAAVRAAAYTANSAFRKALLSDEGLFLIAYSRGACSLQEKSSERVFQR